MKEFLLLKVVTQKYLKMIYLKNGILLVIFSLKFLIRLVSLSLWYMLIDYYYLLLLFKIILKNEIN